MIQYSSVKINNYDDYKKLLDKGLISSKHIDITVIDFLKKYLGNLISEIIIEWPYYDKDYLSTYYIHYAKKFINYPKYCYRLHFITNNGGYCGYTVLRPIIYGRKFGQTYISPEILIKGNAFLLRGDYKVHMNGNEYTVKAFPWMMQETDIAICAHIAAWSVLRYYGNKYNNYLNPTLGEIVDIVHEEWGRKTPSSGLTPVQVSNIMSRFGFYPIIRGGDKSKTDYLLNEMMAYIESGLPIIAMSESKQHAFSIIGHGEIGYRLLDDKNFINKIREPNTNIILNSKLISSVYAMDDNSFPYRRIEKLPDSGSDEDYSMYEISYIVVPLYARMQLEYHEVYSMYLGLVKYSDMCWEGNRIVRIYLTSSNSFKMEIKKLKDLSCILKEVIINLNMPRFIWCVDSSSIDEYKEGKVSGRVIIDATAGTKDLDPWILMHDKEKIKYYDVVDDVTNIIRKVSIEPYEQYVHNLDSIKGY